MVLYLQSNETYETNRRNMHHAKFKNSVLIICVMLFIKDL
jgi:hypothetical protein